MEVNIPQAASAGRAAQALAGGEMAGCCLVPGYGQGAPPPRQRIHSHLQATGYVQLEL